MFRRILTVIIVIPLAVILIAFAVANRQAVTLSFDPFSSADAASTATLPLFVLIFILVILGVIAGGIAAWLGQSRWRRAARRLDGEVRALRDELDAERHRARTVASDAPPRPVIPPPAA